VQTIAHYLIKKATIQDIARELTLSPGTVSRALNDNARISTETKRLVKEKAVSLNYQPNKIAASLRSGKSYTIGVIIPSAQMNFFGSIVHGIELMASNTGYGVMLYQSEESLSLEKKGIDMFLNARVDGILASVSKETIDFSHYLDLEKRNVPLVFFDRTAEELKTPAVVIDDYKGGFLATEHLIKNGYTQIAHVAGPLHIKSFNDRLMGYKAALAKHHIKLNEQLIYQGDISIESGKAAVEYFFKLPVAPDAVFAVEDFTALGVIKALKERAIKIPEAFGVIGFANENFDEYLTPSLSSVDQQTVQMGKDAFKLLLDIISNRESQTRVLLQDKIVLEPILISRKSSSGKAKAL